MQQFNLYRREKSAQRAVIRHNRSIDALDLSALPVYTVYYKRYTESTPNTEGL